MIPSNPTSIVFTLCPAEKAAATLATLLQRGFLVHVNGATSINNLLKKLPGFDQEYITSKIQTLFVNGLAEDDTIRELVAGDTLALSAAMPGLAGAIFRKGGQHASLRSIPRPKAVSREQAPGFITLKLFNVIATDTGPQLLAHGIYIQGRILARFLEKQAHRIQPLVQAITCNNNSVTIQVLAKTIREQEIIHLTISHSSSPA